MPDKMYKLKALINFQYSEIDNITSMYSMKKICSNISNSEFMKDQSVETKGTKIDPPLILQTQDTPFAVIEVQRQQENILAQLAHLKVQMSELQDELYKKSTDECSKINESCENKQTVHMIQWDGIGDEIIVHASPERPPYSLLAINKLWQGVLSVQVVCHTHSSVPTLPAHLTIFSSISSSSKPNLKIRLIWKQMEPDCKIIFSSVNYSPIRGEANLLRYLHRKINDRSDLISDIMQDNILDLSYRLCHLRTVQEKKALIEIFNTTLGKSSWLGGDTATFGDIAAWSSIQSLTGVELTQNLINWQSRCNDLASNVLATSSRTS